MSPGGRGSWGNVEGRAALVPPWVEFLGRWPWDWFCTLTFRDDVHPEAAFKRFRFWIRRLNAALYPDRVRVSGGGRTRVRLRSGQGVRWVAALERQRRGVVHFHALLGSSPSRLTPVLQEFHRAKCTDRWGDIAGYARIQLPRSPEAVNAYCAKYVTKGGDLDLGGPLAQIPLALQEVLRPPLRLEHPPADLVEPVLPDPDPTWAQGELPTLEWQPLLPLVGAGGPLLQRDLPGIP